jgi:hypothetical protein
MRNQKNRFLRPAGAVLSGVLFLAGVTALLVVSLRGGYDIRTGTVLDVLSTHRLFRPLAVSLLALLGLCAAWRPRETRRAVTRLSWKSWLFVFGLWYVVWHTIPAPPDLHGDGLEYIIQTQSIVFDRSLRIDTEKRRAYWNRTNPYGVELTAARPPADELSQEAQAGGGFGGLYPDRRGNYRYYHFWLYSLAVAPLYALFHLLIPGGTLEYQAFRVMNMLFLCLPFMLVWRRARTWPVLLIGVFAVVTPLTGYTAWQHPELFCFCLVFCAFLAAIHSRITWWAPVLLGTAAAQNPPIVLFFIPLIYLMFQYDKRLRPQSKALATAVGLLLAGAPTLYALYWFHVPNVIRAVGLADFSCASWARVTHFFFSPMIGAVWAFPVCFAALPSCIRKKSWLPLLLITGAVVAGAYVCTSTRNFNSSQIWALRYAVWVLAPLWFAITFPDWQNIRFNGNARSMCLAGELLLALACVQFFWAWPLGEKDFRGFLGCGRSGIGVNRLLWHMHYPEDPEVFAENVMARELKRPEQFNDIYCWQIDDRRYIGLAAGTALEKNISLSMTVTGKVSLTASPPNALVLNISGQNVQKITHGPDTNLLAHPRWGGYARFRVSGDIDTLQPAPHVLIRPDTLDRRRKLR